MNNFRNNYAFYKISSLLLKYFGFFKKLSNVSLSFSLYYLSSLSEAYVILLKIVPKDSGFEEKDDLLQLDVH